MKPKLHPVNHPKGGNRFCGPSAISALTGIDTAMASRCLRAITGRSRVTGTGHREMAMALRKFFGFHLSSRGEWPRGKGPTLAAWLRDTVKERTAGRVFLLTAGWHWQVVSGRRYVCGITREIVSITDERVKRRARVSHVYEVLPLAGYEPAPLPEPARRLTRARNSESFARAQARRLAKLHGIEIEVLHAESIMVYPPSDLYPNEEDDPHEGNHHCGDWTEALKMVEEYVHDAQMLRPPAE